MKHRQSIITPARAGETIGRNQYRNKERIGVVTFLLAFFGIAAIIGLIASALLHP